MPIQLILKILLYIVAFISIHLFIHFLIRISINDTHKKILNILKTPIKYTLYIILIISALGTLGINVTPLIASLGLTGFAIGFALKDIISNTLAGLIVTLADNFTLGDSISISGQTGKVCDIQIRYTSIEKEDGSIAYIPNSTILNSIVSVEKKIKPATPTKKIKKPSTTPKTSTTTKAPTAPKAPTTPKAPTAPKK